MHIASNCTHLKVQSRAVGLVYFLKRGRNSTLSQRVVELGHRRNCRCITRRRSPILISCIDNVLVLCLRRRFPIIISCINHVVFLYLIRKTGIYSTTFDSLLAEAQVRQLPTLPLSSIAEECRPWPFPLPPHNRLRCVIVWCGYQS
jgi:hypothetical protein